MLIDPLAAELAVAERLLRAERAAHQDTRASLTEAVLQLQSRPRVPPPLVPQLLTSTTTAEHVAVSPFEALARAEQRVEEAERAARAAIHRERLAIAEADARGAATRTELRGLEAQLRSAQAEAEQRAVALEEARREARLANERASAARARARARARTSVLSPTRQRLSPSGARSRWRSVHNRSPQS